MRKFECSEDCGHCQLGECVDTNNDGYVDICYYDGNCPAKNKEISD